MCSLNRPLLLLDIDGVISLFGFDVGRRPEGRFASVDGIPHFLSAEAARHVTALSADFEVAWCSGWEEKADEHLPYALGLPSGLDHLKFASAGTGESERHWKLDAIEAYAGEDRPLAWVDDAHDTECAAWAAARPGPTLLVTTDPARGLTEIERQRLAAWALRQSKRP